MKFAAIPFVAGLATLLDTATAAYFQNNAPWGLGRLSSVERLAGQDPTALNYGYSFSYTGRGVDVYVLGSGVRITHSQFNGRARWGATFGAGLPNYDDHGKGTHCAGVAAGSQYGVAKEANIIAVKAVGATGTGALSDLVSGIDYVAAQATASRRPSVLVVAANLSNNQVVFQAIARATSRGVHVVVGAGDDAVDTGSVFPGGTSAVVVAASNIADSKASFSNYGSTVSIIAPGENFVSAWNTGDFDYNILSSTVDSACHVAGIVAYLVQRDGNVSPAAMSDKLKYWSVKSRIRGFPGNTANFLAHVPV